jgi:hypothetical protein
MKIFFWTLGLTVLTGLAVAWTWTRENRLSYMNEEYPAFIAKFKMMDSYSKPGLVIFGDSVAQVSIIPDRLSPTTVNFSLGGTSPVETCFFIRRLLKGSVRPKAVLLTFTASHFVLDENFLDRGVLFGLLDNTDANEVLDAAHELNDKDFVPESGFWGAETRLTLFLTAHGFPTYYMPSVLAARFNKRLDGNIKTFQTAVKTRGQCYFGNENVQGSTEQSFSTTFPRFRVDPVIDRYFEKTLDLLEEFGIPCYFIVQPVNDASVSALKKNGFLVGLKDYLREQARSHKQFHLLWDLEPVYSWKYFSDPSHLNREGSEKFSRQLAEVLNKARVTGGPYGVSVR